MARFLPRWRDEWSDKCSFAPLLSADPKFARRCITHDEHYYYGGPRRWRLAADRELRNGLLADGCPGWRAVLVYLLVRTYGHPRFKTPSVSWAFGGNFFTYSDEPAMPEAA